MTRNRSRFNWRIHCALGLLAFVSAMAGCGGHPNASPPLASTGVQADAGQLAGRPPASGLNTKPGKVLPTRGRPVIGFNPTGGVAATQ